MLRRYRYSMEHHWITAAKMGRLYPMFHQEVVPGDTWSGVQQMLVRVEPLNLPAFLRARIDTYFFYVPHRIIWEDFEDFITGAAAPTFPSKNIGIAYSEIWKAFGLGPPASTASYPVSKLPLRAYNLIWNEYFRDQQLQAERTEDQEGLAQVNHQPNSHYLRMRAEIQQGAEATAPVVSSEVAATDMMDAIREQKWKARRAQFGERYYDYLRALGLNVPADRLDRPEFVAKGMGSIGISEVVSTADTTGATVGAYTGHGIAGVQTRFRKKTFLEHGTLLGLYCVRPRHVMRNRVDPQFRLFSSESFYRPELAHNTHEPVTSLELNSKAGTSAGSVAGYLPKYELFRSARDTIAGDMQRPEYESWHASQEFSENAATQILSIMPVQRYNYLFQNTSETDPNFLTYCQNNIGVRRIVPTREVIA